MVENRLLVVLRVGRRRRGGELMVVDRDVRVVLIQRMVGLWLDDGCWREAEQRRRRRWRWAGHEVWLMAKVGRERGRWGRVARSRSGNAQQRWRIGGWERRRRIGVEAVIVAVVLLLDLGHVGKCRLGGRRRSEQLVMRLW
jgi:hypothetical protein